MSWRLATLTASTTRWLSEPRDSVPVQEQQCLHPRDGSGGTCLRTRVTLMVAGTVPCVTGPFSGTQQIEAVSPWMVAVRKRRTLVKKKMAEFLFSDAEQMPRVLVQASLHLCASSTLRKGNPLSSRPREFGDGVIIRCTLVTSVSCLGKSIMKSKGPHKLGIIGISRGSSCLIECPGTSVGQL